MAGGKDKVKCGVCKKSFLEGDKSIGCDGKCKVWYHLHCVNMTEVNYENFRVDKQSKWFCKTCSLAATQSVNKDDSPTLQDIMNQLKYLVSEVRELRNENKDLKVSLTFTQTQLEEKQKEFQQVLNEIKTLRTEVVELKRENQNLQQYTRINNVEIHGIPVIKDENPAEIVVNLGKHLGVAIDHRQIDVCHRLPSRSSDFPPTLLVKFCSRITKNVLLNAKKKNRNLRSADLGVNAPSRMVYLNEHLSPSNRMLLKKAMELKQHGFKYVWTRDCRILVRKNDTSSVNNITSQEDLHKILQEIK